jgi:hypothetical protein
VSYTWGDSHLLIRRIARMKSYYLAPVIVLAVAVLTYQFRYELQLAEPIGALSSSIGLSSLGHSQPGFDWPPRLGETYPDLELYDQEGHLTRLSDFRGKIILIEPIGMPCKACQALCGGHQRGGFNGIPPQPDLPSIDEAARSYGGFDLSDPRIVQVHLLLFDFDMQAPTLDDARAWAAHFGMDRNRNQIVLAGSLSMVNQASYEMIPGLQLVDQDFALRYDSTGHTARHDLYRELLPAVRTLLNR